MTVTARARRAFPTLVLAVATCVGVLGGSSAVEARTDPTARAATIVGMLRFVEWRAPAARRGLTVAVLDDTALAQALRHAAAGVKPGGRPLTIVDVATTQDLRALEATVVVLGAGHAADAPALARRGVLTVGNGNCPDDRRLALNLVADGTRLRFTANVGAAARAGVSLSSRLLRLATEVTE